MDEKGENNEIIESNDGVFLESTKKKQNIQIMWAVILMGSLILIIILAPMISNQIFNKFHYNNLEFQKTKVGTINFYSTKIPLTRTVPITGAFIKKDDISGSFDLNLRNDPRKLEYIPVNIPNNTISFRGKTVYITMNTYDKPCEQNVISAVTLTNFLISFGNKKVEGAVTDLNYSTEYKIPYITCENSDSNTVIYFKEDTKTSIEKISPTCYELSYNNCEMLQVSEKFILTILEGYMSYFEGGEKLIRPLV
jgi:hypothetical protein